MAAENYNVSFKLDIADNVLNNYLPENIYQLLKTIYDDLLETKVVCDNMLQAIERLKVEDVKINIKSYCKGSSIRKLNDGEIFKCWARNRVRSVSKKIFLKLKDFLEKKSI